MLERLYIEATENMPRVVLDEKEGKFMLSGRSLPENTEKAYRPIIDWITRYVENPLKETVFEINLDYYNSTSLKKMVDILLLFKTANDSGKSKVKVIWYYEDGDEGSRDNGEDICYAVNLPVEVKMRDF
ncbi:MAG: DUF1987 domain-containing protein [Bacteroidales bacterium]|jgi:hypothetical protein|nr:DUF1987 domain-containing protein [Bacteroidales bacterium]MBQ5540916.1 DUF1987 domain-containing protein [Bacteroidales bacterium]MBR6278681.1 DUF1987 domain-containing protein [Bacteroidales bacterium]